MLIGKIVICCIISRIMGIHIYFYAVDRPKFDAFLELPVGEVLFFLAKGGGYVFAVLNEPNSFAIKDGEVRFQQSYQDPYITISENEMINYPFLTTQLRTYPDKGHAMFFSLLCMDLTDCSVDWFQAINRGFGQYWIGSLLESIEQIGDVGGITFDEIRPLFQRLLGRFDCGKRLPVLMYNLKQSNFPVNPLYDLDCEMSVWTNEEVKLIMEFIKAVKADPSIKFSRPPDYHSTYPDDDWWHEHVEFMLDELLKIDTLDYDEVNVISFID